jgi:type II secretory pathway pseudopilin PulG
MTVRAAPPPAPQGARCGFVLAEVIVAAVLASIGMLAVVATAQHARARLRVAAIDERVTRAAAMTLDSLRATGAATDGAMPRDGLALEWRVDDDGMVALSIHFADGGGARVRHYTTRLDTGAP